MRRRQHRALRPRSGARRGPRPARAGHGAGPADGLGARDASAWTRPAPCGPAPRTPGSSSASARCCTAGHRAASWRPASGTRPRRSGPSPARGSPGRASDDLPHPEVPTSANEVSAGAAEELVDLLLAAEEDVDLVALERAEARVGPGRSCGCGGCAGGHTGSLARRRSKKVSKAPVSGPAWHFIRWSRTFDSVIPGRSAWYAAAVLHTPRSRSAAAPAAPASSARAAAALDPERVRLAEDQDHRIAFGEVLLEVLAVISGLPTAIGST